MNSPSEEIYGKSTQGTHYVDLKRYIQWLKMKA